jgi:hypothetical protein
MKSDYRIGSVRITRKDAKLLNDEIRMTNDEAQNGEVIR